MRPWKAICTHAEKEKLGDFLREILLYSELSRREKYGSAAATCEIPHYIVTDIPDEEGNHIIVDADTGEITPFVAVKHTMKGATNWTAAIYLNGEQANKKEAYREESLF